MTNLRKTMTKMGPPLMKDKSKKSQAQSNKIKIESKKERETFTKKIHQSS